MITILQSERNDLLFLMALDPLIQAPLLVLRYTRNLCKEIIHKAAIMYDEAWKKLTSEIVLAFLTTSMKPVFLLVARQP